MPTLLQWLTERYPEAKRQTFKRMLGAKRLLINGQPARLVSQSIHEQDRVKVLPASAKPIMRPRSPLQIVYEDEDILVVNKPAGLLTSTVPHEKRETLLAMVREHAGHRDPAARIGLIHRLDRDASGLLIFSKNNRAYRSLKTQFFEHSVDRIYLAVVAGEPKQKRRRIETHLVERADGTVYSTKQRNRGQRAVTEYEVIAREGKTSLLRVRLHTGRKHQIRVHLSEIGYPIVGDRMYGDASTDAHLMLAAVELSFEHPRTKCRLHFEIPPPAEFTARVPSRSSRV